MKQKKLSKPYEGDDIKDFINANKTYHTPSQAFKDAKYAEWLELDPEMSDMKKFVLDLCCWGIPLIAIALCIMFAVIQGVK